MAAQVPPQLDVAVRTPQAGVSLSDSWKSWGWEDGRQRGLMVDRGLRLNPVGFPSAPGLWSAPCCPSIQSSLEEGPELPPPPARVSRESGSYLQLQPAALVLLILAGRSAGGRVGECPACKPVGFCHYPGNKFQALLSSSLRC